MIKIFSMLVLLLSLLTFSVISQTVTTDELSEKLRKCISDSVTDKYGCTVWISNKKNFGFHEGFGYLDFEHKNKIEQNVPRAYFNIASITKTITAAGIMRLFENGKLSFHDTIGRFFEEVPYDKRKITIHQLLTHSSGLQQNYAADGVSSRDSAVLLILNDKLGSEPGTGFSYSNENYQLLAAIIEIIANEDYEKFIRYQLLSGMGQFFFWDEYLFLDESQIASKKRYIPKESIKRNWGFVGSNGIYSSTVGLFQFFQSIKEHIILKENTVNLMFESYVKLDDGLGIGYGWFINRTAWGTTEYWTRGTEDFGHNAVIRWFPDDDDTVIIVCSNSGEIYGPRGTANRTISDAIISIIFHNKK